jgi:hypothetical protein
MTRFLRRARWLVPIWALTLVALAVSLYAGLWLNALVLLVIGWLSVYAERLHQALVDTTAERDRYLDKAIAYRLRLTVRQPVLHCED